LEAEVEVESEGHDEATALLYLGTAAMLVSPAAEMALEAEVSSRATVVACMDDLPALSYVVDVGSPLSSSMPLLTGFVPVASTSLPVGGASSGEDVARDVAAAGDVMIAHVATVGQSAETDVAAPASGRMNKSRAGRRWWGQTDDHGADGITEAQFAEFATSVAIVPKLDPRFSKVFSVRTSTLGEEAGRGLFFNVAEATRQGLTLPLFLPLCGIARKAGGISVGEKKINGCLLDTGLCVQNEPVSTFFLK
jgi:hypothetical protein